MPKLKHILYNPFFISLFIWGGILLILPQFQKYQMELVNNFNISNSEKSLFYSLSKKGEVAEIDTKMKIYLHPKIENVSFSDYFQLDLDNDGQDEYLFVGTNQQSIIITRNDFSHPTKLELPFFECNQPIHIEFTNKIFPQLSIICGNQHFYFNYLKNRLYSYRFFIILAVYIIVLIGCIIAHRILHSYIQLKRRCKKEIAELKLRNIRNQLDPHFTLNVLNSIGYSFQATDPETADYIFGKYAKLLRTTIFSSNSANVSISTEMEYIKDYLDIERFRMEDRFQYTLAPIPQDAEQLLLPKMMLHTFVENSIKHGIKPLNKNGHLSINFEKNDHQLIILIQDNGIGRKEARVNNSITTGKGLKIIDEMIELYFELEKIKIHYEIIDIYDADQKPKGTLIKVYYPILK